MVFRELVAKERMFVHKLNAHEWINENYPNAIESKVTPSKGYYWAEVWVMEDVEYNNILIPIEHLEGIRKYALDKNNNPEIVQLLDNLLNNFKKIK